MQKLADQSTSMRELKPEECQQVSGGLLSADMDLKDFPVIAWPRINVAINAKQFAAKTFG